MVRKHKARYSACAVILESSNAAAQRRDQTIAAPGARPGRRYPVVPHQLCTLILTYILGASFTPFQSLYNGGTLEDYLGKGTSSIVFALSLPLNQLNS